MERQNRLLTGLATVLLVLVAIAVFGRKPEDKPTDPDAPAERKLFEKLDKETVQGLTLKTATSTLTFAKADGAWKMTSPKEILVEDRKVTEIVDRFASLKVQEEGFDGDLAAFGLDEANRVEVLIAAGDGTTLTVYVGKDAPVGYRSYIAQSATGPALLAASKVGDIVNRGPDDFRSKDVWRVSTATASRITLEDAGKSLSLRKDDHGWWLADGPRAKTSTVEDWLARAAYLRADSFLDGADPATIGLAPATQRITIEDGDGTHVLELGTRDADGVAVRSEGNTVRVGGEAIGDLVKLSGWEDTALLPVRRDKIDGVEITLGAKTGRWTKTDGAWKDATGADAAGVDALLDAISDATVDRSVVTAAEGSWGSVTLTEGEMGKESVTFAQETAGGRVGKDASGGPGFLVPAATLSALDAALPK